MKLPTPSACVPASERARFGGGPGGEAYDSSPLFVLVDVVQDIESREVHTGRSNPRYPESESGCCNGDTSASYSGVSTMRTFRLSVVCFSACD